MQAPAPFTGGPALRAFQLLGDGFEPALRSRDYLLCVPADRYAYEATYLLRWEDGEAPYMAQGRPDGIHIYHPNPKYSDGWTIPRDEFNARVTAIAVAEVRVQDTRAFECAAGRLLEAA